MVIDALLNQNNVEDLLAKTCNCPTIYDLSLSIQAPIKSLFERSFRLLSDLKIRDKQYKTIFSRIRFKVCPFCGCEYFDAPSAKREALDHYLAESKYPFAAANLKNLAPMGAKCNSKYKLAKDILYADDGSRRAAFYPYTAPGLQVSLDLSQPKDGDDGSLTFDWSVEFLEPSEEAETWDHVFEIRERYKRDILDVCFRDWLEEFKNWCVIANFVFEMDMHVIDAIDRFAWYQHQCFKDMAFLKASVFRMIKKHCIDGNERIFQVMRDLTGMTGVAV